MLIYALDESGTCNRIQMRLEGGFTKNWGRQCIRTTDEEVEATAAFVHQAVNSHHDLIEALREARKIIADIDDYMKRPSRGDWGEECACCMGELLDDDRQAIAKIDAILTKAEAGHG
ncbi:hypothetical protein C7W88_17050 [Novosphingobium sp. THN1]|nr:hypothetical protein C7W88_12735 [Novosphingobium sp. THN1]AXU20386.1 hypothetical protein C7W88_17050 [Novosphingobium sp. THN1]